MFWAQKRLTEPSLHTTAGRVTLLRTTLAEEVWKEWQPLLEISTGLTHRTRKKISNTGVADNLKVLTNLGLVIREKRGGLFWCSRGGSAMFGKGERFLARRKGNEMGQNGTALNNGVTDEKILGTLQSYPEGTNASEVARAIHAPYRNVLDYMNDMVASRKIRREKNTYIAPAKTKPTSSKKTSEACTACTKEGCTQPPYPKLDLCRTHLRVPSDAIMEAISARVSSAPMTSQEIYSAIGDEHISLNRVVDGLRVLVLLGEVTREQKGFAIFKYSRRIKNGFVDLATEAAKKPAPEQKAAPPVPVDLTIDNVVNQLRNILSEKDQKIADLEGKVQLLNKLKEVDITESVMNVLLDALRARKLRIDDLVAVLGA